jgi:ParB-like chromosome segregation protein Spo0J
MAGKGRAVIEKKNQTLERLKIEYVPAASITPNDYNPNVQSEHDFYLLCKSILEDGFTQPIVVQQQTREIIDGEHRWTAEIVCEAIRRLAKGRGKKVEEVLTRELVRTYRDDRLGTLEQVPDVEIPVVMTDMTPEQMRIATLRHNRARGNENVDLTAQVLRDLQQLGALEWAQDSLELDDVELNRLLEDIPAPDALAGEEFTQAWEPDRGPADTERDPASVEASVVRTPSGDSAAAMTRSALEATRRREQALAAAKTEEDRAAIRRDNANFLRLVLTFNGEEATVVKAALGSAPAETVLAMCRERQPAAPAGAEV